MVYEGTDFGFPSPLPLEWSRAWYSDSEYEGWLGHGVHCCYDRTVESFEDEGVTMLRMEDGRAVAFPPIAPGGEFYMRTERTTLRRIEKATRHTAMTACSHTASTCGTAVHGT
ncbi:DUF6531 domain-containing protein [Bacteroides fragilis]